jgi:hypothetical protein
MKFEIYGDKIDLADELEDDFRKEAKATVREAGSMYLAALKATLQRGPRGGPSEPEQVPAIQKEDLLKSFRRSGAKLGRDKRSVSVDITSDLHYKEVWGVESGHVKRTGHRVLPRPFIRPTDAEMEPKIGKLFEERL